MIPLLFGNIGATGALVKEIENEIKTTTAPDSEKDNNA